MAHIICFGDSITYGESDAINGGWVSLLKRHFLAKHLSSPTQQDVIYNLGIGRETVDGLASRFKQEISSRLSSRANGVIILSYGCNDLTRIIDRHGQTKNRVPLEYFQAKLQTCVEWSQSKNYRVIINNIIPFAQKDDGVANRYGEVRRYQDVMQYNQVIEKVTMQTNCRLNDLYQLFAERVVEELLSEDGLHPNQLGHQIIFDSIKTLLDAH